jgi:glycosyltransferase involved in cell wall biosynthesis
MPGLSERLSHGRYLSGRANAAGSFVLFNYGLNKSVMRILAVSQYFAPDITAAAFRISDFAKGFARAGHDVTVVTTEPHRGTARDSAPPDTMLESLNIRRIGLSEVRMGGFVNYVKHYMSFVFGSAAEALRLWFAGYRPDVIWATSPPLFAGLAGRIMSILFRCPMVLDVRDIWPESAVSAGQLREGGTAFKIGKRLESYLYGRSRAITCVAQPMAEYLRTQTAVPISVIYNGIPASEAQFQPVSKVNRRGPRQILYAGNLGRVQQLELLLRAVRDLKNSGKIADWIIRIIGGGALAAELAKQVDDADISDVVNLEPPVSRAVVFEQLCSADLLYLGLKPDPVLRMTIPSKLFDYLMAARPIIGGISGEGQDILQSTGANVCFEPGNPHSLRGALVEATSRCTELEQWAHKNRELVLERFTRESATSKLLNVLTDALHR